LTAFFLVRRHPLAFSTYALVLAGSLAWALYEVGFEWWSLAPRGGLIVLIGLLLLIPWWRHRSAEIVTFAAWRTAGLTMILALAAAIGTGLYAMATDSGPLVAGEVGPASSASLPPSEATPAEEWVAYGRTPGGSHYSPLDTI